MAFTSNPQIWLPGISVTTINGNSFLMIPLNKLPELKAVEVTGASADIRRIIWALIDGLFHLINGTPVADRPNKITIKRVTNEIGPRLTRLYSFGFELTKESIDVIPEP